MSKTFLLVIALCIELTIIAISNGQKLACSKKSNKEIDQMTPRIINYGNSGRKFPENKEQLDTFCAEQRTDLATIDEYSKRCNKGMAKRMISILMFMQKKVLDEMCNKREKKFSKDNLAAGKCFNSGADEMEKCNAKIIDNMLGIKHAENNKKLSFMCCENFKYKTCVVNVANATRGCTPHNVKTLDNNFEGLSGTLFTTICGDYSTDRAKCAALGEAPKKRKNQKRSRSFFIPMVDVFSSLE